ncbi:hypothetical protein HDK90DRAFT_116924 [Phyllosticta capitalensis]|uniref:Uncharacterized protein n=1 Tax=Phyllosticta capitalensis TaxID=121624 RepID=A0ABR1Y9F3_9PEZI
MPGASLLSLPREIRDQILDLCLTTALPPPPPNQIYTTQPLSFSEFLTSSAQKKSQPHVNFPVAPRTNSGGLLLTSRQIGAETRDALERLNGHGKLNYIMRFRIEEEEGDAVGDRERYWVDWAVLPTKSWLKTSRRAKDTTSAKEKSKFNTNAQSPVNLVIEVEKTMRAKPTRPPQAQGQGEEEQGQQQQQHNYDDEDNDVDGQQHVFEPPPALSALYRRYHFLCRPEYRPRPPLSRPARRSLLGAADHGVLLLHWTLGDLVARVVDEGPCFASTARPASASSAASSTSSSSSSSSASPSSSSSQRPDHHQPVPFTLTLRHRASSSSSPSPSSTAMAQTSSVRSHSPTQPLATPLREFLPFYLHSAKLTHTPFGALISRGLLRGFALDARGHHDDATRQRQTNGRPHGQAACPVPEGGCCSGGIGGTLQQGGGGDGAAALQLHWVCGVVRDGVRDAGVVENERDYDDDW